MPSFALTFVSFYLLAVVLIAGVLSWVLLASAKGRDAYIAQLTAEVYPLAVGYLGEPTFRRSFLHFFQGALRPISSVATNAGGQDDYEWLTTLKNTKQSVPGATDREAFCNALERVTGQTGAPALHAVIEDRAETFMNRHKVAIRSATSATELRAAHKSARKSIKDETSGNHTSAYWRSLVTQLADYVGRGTALGFLLAIVISSIATASGNRQVNMLDIVSVVSVIGGTAGAVQYSRVLAGALGESRQDLSVTTRLPWWERPLIFSLIFPVIVAVTMPFVMRAM